jgi:outer membrane protein insertion porin family/translocation and assembly module TamA
MVKRPMLQQALQLGRSCFRRLFLTSLTATSLLGCASELRERTVSDVRVVETAPSDADVDDVLSGLVTAKPRTLWLGLKTERDVYDANLIARDLERIERYYRAQGYYDVKVVAARVQAVGERQVDVEVHVTPGPRVTVRKVQEDQAAVLSLPSDVQFKYTKVPKPRAGRPFTEATLDKYRTALTDMLKESGFAYAKVKVTASVDLNAGAADITCVMQPGKRARFGAIRISGLRQIPESKVRAALDLKTGDQYSDAEQADARDALSDMQLFTRVEVTPDLSDPNVEDIPILVTVQEDQLRKLQLGGGTVIDSLKLEAHLTSGWEHKNFLGGARKLSIQGSGGVDFFPTRLENTSTLTKWTNVFPTAQASVTLEQPSLFNGRTRGSVQAAYSIRPILYTLSEEALKHPEEQTVLGYHEPRGQLALERTFLGKRIYVKGSYNLVARIPLWYQNEACTPNPNGGQCLKGAGLETVFVSYPRFESVFQFLPGDLFEDRAKRDLVLSFRNSLEIAGASLNGTRIFGGSLSDVKIEPELRGAVPILAKRRNPEQQSGDLMLAGRLRFGFLFAADYGESLRTDRPAQTGNNNVDQQKLLIRAFYAGGATSNRGYAYNAISPYGPIGFLAPTTINCGDPTLTPDKLSQCLRPLGGFTKWEASLELRYAGFYPLSLALFADTSDVSRDIGRVSFYYPHLSVGPGVRYETPVGPLRLDLGIRVPGAQAWGKAHLPEDGSHGQERPETLFLLPAAIQLAIGDAF